MDKEFAGKKILVTGASSGLGKEIAVDLSNRGAQLVLVGRNIDALKKTYEELNEGEHQFFSYDLSMNNEYTDLFEMVIRDGVKLDGMVHCAGIVPLTPIRTLKWEKIEECFTINFMALIELVRCFSKKKYRTDKTSIVEISSISSLYPGNCQTLYASSKAAANTAVQSMAIELSSKGIRINTILPGIIDTPATQEAIKKIGKETHDKVLKNQLHGLISMSEVARVVAFLLGEGAAAINGRPIYCDGGYINF